MLNLALGLVILATATRIVLAAHAEALERGKLRGFTATIKGYALGAFSGGLAGLIAGI